MFPLLAIAVAIFAIIRGYRRGLTGQVTSVLGLAFGVICAHIFLEGGSDVVAMLIGRERLERSGRYLTENLSAAAVYATVYVVFRSVTGLVRAALKTLGSSLLNSLLGAAFCLYSYMLVLSMIFNVAVGWNPDSVLMHDGRSGDGNIVAVVLSISPAALGTVSFDEFAHEQQLRDARKISHRLSPADAMTPQGSCELMTQT